LPSAGLKLELVAGESLAGGGLPLQNTSLRPFRISQFAGEPPPAADLGKTAAFVAALGVPVIAPRIEDDQNVVG